MKHAVAFLVRGLQWAAIGTVAVAAGTILAAKVMSNPGGVQASQ